MNIQQYIEKNKNNYKSFLEHLDTKNSEDYQILYEYIKDLKIHGNHNELGIVLRFILNISNNHHRHADFFKKIDQILLQFKDDIKQYYTNFDLFRHFKSNKRILLFLIKEQILTIDEFVAEKLLSEKYRKFGYHIYFFPEIKEYMDSYTKLQTEYQFKKYNQNGINLFDLQRRVGQNDSNITSYIREDSLTQFLSYVKDRKITFSTPIEYSIFETNQFLLDKKPTVLEYAAFFGSYEIFNHLVVQKKAKLQPSIWLYAIHGNNSKILKMLVDRKILPEDETYFKCIKEGIKCHHNELINYIQTKIMKTQSIEDYKVKTKSIKYVNFEYLPNDLTNGYFFYKLCQFDYVTLVGILLKFKNINTGFVVIQNFHFFNKISIEFIFIKFQNYFHKYNFYLFLF